MRNCSSFLRGIVGDGSIGSAMTPDQAWKQIRRALDAIRYLIEQAPDSKNGSECTLTNPGAVDGADPGSSFSDLVNEFVSLWNSIAAVSKVRVFNDKRKQTFRARLKDEWWRENYREALARIPTIPFLVGANEKKWVATVEWFLRPSSVTKVLEGRYDTLHNLSDDDVVSQAARALKLSEGASNLPEQDTGENFDWGLGREDEEL